jgi:lipopolysaccharide biosynthesis glycosyltransferase
MKLSVVYSSDNHYAQHLGVSLLSLFENNKHFDQIDVFLFENSMSKENKEKLMLVSQRYNRNLTYIDFTVLSDKLKLSIGSSISVNSYARLLLSSVLDHLDKVIYLDCDSIINHSLSDLWNLDIHEYYAAGVLDTVSDHTKARINLDRNSAYINAGMMLINLHKWREEDVENKFIRFIDLHGGQVFHHDQGTINGVLHTKFLLLHPKYNAMTTFFTMTREEMMAYYGLYQYYTEFELNEAVRHPVFVHFTPAFVNRPWIEGCRHPLAELYTKYLDMSPWKGVSLSKDRRGIAEKAIAFLYNHLPFRMANGLCKLIPR